MREKQREMVAAQIAYSVEKALIAEVELSPKPGLVDAHSTGAHHDMDLSLFLRSAKSLTPFSNKNGYCIVEPSNRPRIT